MAEDFYGGGDEEGSSEGMAGGDGPKKSDSGMGEESTLVPRSMFGDQEVEVGAEYIFKVEHVFEKEVELSYAKSPEKKERDSMTEESDTPEKAFDSKFSMMGNEGGGGGY